MKTHHAIKFAAVAIGLGAALSANAGGLLGGGLGGGLGGSLGGNLNGSLNGMGGLNRPIVTEGAGRSAIGAVRGNAGSQLDATRGYGRATAANARATGGAVQDVAGAVQGPDVATTARSVNLGGKVSGSGNANANANGNSAAVAKPENKTD
jgi:hypothetical protein